MCCKKEKYDDRVICKICIGQNLASRSNGLGGSRQCQDLFITFANLKMHPSCANNKSQNGLPTVTIFSTHCKCLSGLLSFDRFQKVLEALRQLSPYLAI